LLWLIQNDLDHIKFELDVNNIKIELLMEFRDLNYFLVQLDLKFFPKFKQNVFYESPLFYSSFYQQYVEGVL